MVIEAIKSYHIYVTLVDVPPNGGIPQLKRVLGSTTVPSKVCVFVLIATATVSWPVLVPFTIACTGYRVASNRAWLHTAINICN